MDRRRFSTLQVQVYRSTGPAATGATFSILFVPPREYAVVGERNTIEKDYSTKFVVTYLFQFQYMHVKFKHS